MNNSSLIAIIGMDGSGKSANINLMKEDLSFSNYHFLWVRWEPCILKPLYNIVNKKSKTDTETLNQSYNRKLEIKKKIFKNILVKNIWLYLTIIDYTLQFKRKITKVLKTGKSIIFDRYYLDLFIDQGVNLDLSPEQIKKMIQKFAWLFPKMEKTLYIRVKPEVCFSRKNDIPNMDYLWVRWGIYEYLSQTFDWIIIDGEKSLREVYSTMKDYVL